MEMPSQELPLPGEEQLARGGRAVISHSNLSSRLFAQVDFALQQEEAQTHEIERGCVPACCEPWSLFAKGCSGASSPFSLSLPATPPMSLFLPEVPAEAVVILEVVACFREAAL